MTKDFFFLLSQKFIIFLWVFLSQYFISKLKITSGQHHPDTSADQQKAQTHLQTVPKNTHSFTVNLSYSQ